MLNSDQIIAEALKLPHYQALQSLLEMLPSVAELYLVGGAVRDLALAKSPHDFDLTTNISPEILKETLIANGVKVFSLGETHNTISCLLKELPGPIEITTFRTAGWSPSQGNTIGKSIDEDLRYRDFTINSMAIDLRRVEFIDPNNGLVDIVKKQIRAVGDAHDRFLEDPLRILRMIRFSTELSFQIESETFEVAQRHSKLLKTVAIERVRDEFSKILISSCAADGIRALQKLSFFINFIPEVEKFVNFEQNKFHSLNLFDHTIATVEGVGPEITLRLAALLHDVGKPDTLTVDELGGRHFYRHESVGAEIAESVLKRMKYPAAVIKDVKQLIALHMRSHQSGPTGIRRILRDTGELYNQWRELKESDARACKENMDFIIDELQLFDRRVEEIRNKERDSFFKLVITGHDIIALGVKPGPKIGDIIEALKEEVLHRPEDNVRGVLLEKAKKLLQ